MQHTKNEPRDGEVKITPVKPEDVPAIVAIDLEITGISKPELWYSHYSSTGSGQPRWFLAARVGDAVAGYIVGEVRSWEFGSPPCGWIFAIGVAANYRSMGIGTLLFDAITEQFISADVAIVRTMISIDEHVLMSFFRSKGMSAGPFIELEARLDP